MVGYMEYKREKESLDELKDLVDHCVVVPSDSMMRIEDVHMVLDHCISSTLRELIAKEGMTPQ